MFTKTFLKHVKPSRIFTLIVFFCSKSLNCLYLLRLNKLVLVNVNFQSCIKGGQNSLCFNNKIFKETFLKTFTSNNVNIINAFSHQ